MSYLLGFLINPFFLLALILIAAHLLVKKKSPVVRLLFFNIISLLLIAAVFDNIFASLLIKKDNLFRTDHRYYHHGLKPYQDQMTKWGSFGSPYPVKTNSLGMLDASTREVSLKKQGKRIVIMGDSFVEGVGYAYEKTIPGIIAQKLAPKGIEVLDAGTVSYSPKLYYLRTKYLLEQGLTFDELYLFIDIGDIQDEILYAYFVPAADTGSLFSERVALFYYQHSWFFRALRDRFSYRQENPRHDSSDYWGGFLEHYRVRPRWTHDEKEFERWGKEGLTSALEYTDKLLKLLKEHGITLHLSVHPWREQLVWEDGTNRQQSAWGIFCAERDIDFIDFFPLFQGEEPVEEVIKKYFIDKDIHWNDAGMRLIAEELLKHIEGNSAP